MTRWACGTGILVAGEDLAGHQAREVGHVDHEGRPDLVGDLPHLGEVDPPRVGRVAGDQDQRLELVGRPGAPVVVDQLGLRVGAVRALVEHLARDVGPEAVSEVAARVQRHAERALVAELVPQVLPLLLGQVVDALDAQRGQRRAARSAGRGSPRRRPGWRRCRSAAGRRRIRRRKARGRARRPAPRRCRCSGSRRRSGVRWCPRRTCPTARCPWSAARRARRSSPRRSASASSAGRPVRPASRRRFGARWSRSPTARPGRPRKRWRSSRRRDRWGQGCRSRRLLGRVGRAVTNLSRPRDHSAANSSGGGPETVVGRVLSLSKDRDEAMIAMIRKLRG